MKGNNTYSFVLVDHCVFGWLCGLMRIFSFLFFSRDPLFPLFNLPFLALQLSNEQNWWCLWRYKEWTPMQMGQW